MKIRAQNLTIHDTLVRLFLLAALFTGFFCLGGLVGCGASGLLPQTSLPLPENDDPITISSPNAAGYVVITGGDDAVPESSTIIVTVSSASSNLDLKKIGEAFISVANAATCSSDLPQCPELSADSQCQFTANDDGSFTLSVPASLSNSISVNYLDPTTCEEIQAYEEVVEAGIVSIDMDVDSMATDDTSGLLYLIGSDSEQNKIVRVMDPDTQDYTDVSLDMQIETVSFLRLFTDHLGNRMMVISLGLKTLLGPVLADGSINLDDFITLVDNNGNPLENLRFQQATSVERDPSLDTCVGVSLFEADETLRFTRLFFTFQDVIHILEYEDNHRDVDPSYIYSSDKLIPRHLNLDAAEAIADKATLTDPSALDILSIEVSDNHIYMFVNVVDSQNHFFLLEFGSPPPLCQSLIQFKAELDQSLYLGTAEVVNARSFMVYTEEGSDETRTLFMVHKILESVVLIVDMRSDQFGCTDQYGVMYLPGSSGVPDDSACINQDIESITMTDMDVSSVVMIEPIFYDTDRPEIFLLGENNGGSDFYPREETSVFESDDEPLYVINPAAADYIAETNQLVVIDTGPKGDGFSNIVYYDLAAEPLLW